MWEWIWPRLRLEFIKASSSAFFFWYDSIYRFSCRYFCPAPLYTVIVYTTCLLAMLISLILPYAFHKSEYAYSKLAFCPFCKRVHDNNVLMCIFAAVISIFLVRIKEYAINLFHFYWLRLLLGLNVNCVHVFEV